MSRNRRGNSDDRGLRGYRSPQPVLTSAEAARHTLNHDSVSAAPHVAAGETCSASDTSGFARIVDGLRCNSHRRLPAHQRDRF